MKIKRFRVFQIRDWIIRNRNEKDGEFHYYHGLSKNLRIILKEIEDASAGLSDQLEFERQVSDINNSLMEKLKYVKEVEEINRLKRDAESVIAGIYNKYNEMGTFERTEKVMNEEIEIEFYKISPDSFPKKIINSDDEYNIIEPLVA